MGGSNPKLKNSERTGKEKKANDTGARVGVAAPAPGPLQHNEMDHQFLDVAHLIGPRAFRFHQVALRRLQHLERIRSRACQERVARQFLKSDTPKHRTADLAGYAPTQDCILSATRARAAAKAGISRSRWVR